jgi:hypothetical protein
MKKNDVTISLIDIYFPLATFQITFYKAEKKARGIPEQHH